MILDLYILQLLCHMQLSLTSWGFAKLGQSNCSIYHSHWLCMKVPVSLQSSWLVSVICTPLWSWFTLWHLQWLFHLKFLPIFTFFEKCFISYTNYQQTFIMASPHTHKTYFDNIPAVTFLVPLLPHWSLPSCCVLRFLSIGNGWLANIFSLCLDDL